MSTASELLALYIDAEKKILQGQEVLWGDKRLTRADLGRVQTERHRLEQRVAAEQRRGRPGYSRVRFS